MTDLERWAKPDGGAREEAETLLGWKQPVELYRPILSYEELGNLFAEGPSALYDALNKILGLDEITDAAKRIDVALKALSDPRKHANAARTQLRKELTASPLDQAKAVMTALRPREADLEAVRALVTGSRSPQDRLVAQLQAVAEMPAVAEEADIAACVGELRSAIDESIHTGGATLQLLNQRTALLDAAVRYVRHTETGECPVCDSELPVGWAAHTDAVIEDNRATMADYARSAERLDAAQRQARELLGRWQIPELDDGFESAAELSELDAYRRAVEHARQIPDGPAELAEHTATAMAAAAEALSALREPAAALATRLDDEWAPLATKVMAWLQAESEARPLDGTVGQLKAAKAWLQENADVLRARRVAPISAEATRIWSKLRQQSDIDLTGISLSGRNTSRRVDLEGTVDGHESSVLSLMSQGELQALALALFIPRATLPASPFGFLVLDDPIQAMDPAKIDGFLEVLQELAKTRQVVVFSHDDRLPSAIRRLAVDAQLLTVTRAPGSMVTVDPSDVPADRVVKNVRSLIFDPELPDAIKNDAGPGLFRMAVESAARQCFFVAAARRGLSQRDAEKLWSEAQGTKALVCLSLDLDDEGYRRWVNVRAYRNDVMRVCTQGAHRGAVLDGRDIRALEDTINDVLGLSRVR